jgi:hypothetical protein
VGGNEKTVNLISHEDVAVAGWLKRTWQTVLQVRNVSLRHVGIASMIALVAYVLILGVARLRSRPKSEPKRRPPRYS